MNSSNHINDILAQCSEKLVKLSDEEQNKRINEIRNCNHLFVKLREKNVDATENIAIVECVHCGVTNKYQDVEKTVIRFRKSLEYYLLTKFKKNNIEYNSETIETMMMREILNVDDNINMLSKEGIRTLHPGLLYQLAKRIHEDASDEEIFLIMQKLNDLETASEKIKLLSVDDASNLLGRYNKQNKILIKK